MPSMSGVRRKTAAPPPPAPSRHSGHGASAVVQWAIPCRIAVRFSRLLDGDGLAVEAGRGFAPGRRGRRLGGRRRGKRETRDGKEATKTKPQKWKREQRLQR